MVLKPIMQQKSGETKKNEKTMQHSGENFLKPKKFIFDL